MREMALPKQWWRRTAAAAKDKRSLCLTRVASKGNPDMETAVIRATSHDELSIDYKNARRVFAWARTSPSSFLHPLMWALSRRASRTRSWAVALKSLLLAHGLLLCSSATAGRLPFDLSEFRDRSARSWGFSAFVRAYFSFLDHRFLFLIHHRRDPDDEEECGGLERVERLQALLDLLLQIRPLADGMQVCLILEAMDCAMIEIFEVYSGICNGIACFLVGYMGGGNGDGGRAEERRRRGLVGIRVLRKATEQNDQLASYFDLCRRMGVQNAAGLPPVERISEEDIRDLEKLVMGGITEEMEEEEKTTGGAPGTVVTGVWVVFDNEMRERKEERSSTSSLSSPESSALEVGDLIEL